MNTVMIRAKLGIPLHGPYSRNRRRRTRRPLREFIPALIVTGLAVGVVAFFTALFI